MADFKAKWRARVAAFLAGQANEVAGIYAELKRAVHRGLSGVAVFSLALLTSLYISI